MVDIKTESKPEGLDLFSQEFPVPTPEKSSWTERLKTLVRNAGVDRGRVEIDSSESEIFPLQIYKRIPFTFDLGSFCK